MLAGTGVWKISSVACGFSSIKIYFSDYLKSLISRINEAYVVVFSIKYHHSKTLTSSNTFAAKHLEKPIPTVAFGSESVKLFVLLQSHLFFVNIVSVTSALLDKRSFANVVEIELIRRHYN